MSRDGVIKRVADIVGPKHSVDLKNFDLLILVEIYRVSRIFDIFSTYNVGFADKLMTLRIQPECMRHERGWSRLRDAETIQLGGNIRVQVKGGRSEGGGW